MKHLKNMLIYCLSLAIIITFTPAAFAADGANSQEGTALHQSGQPYTMWVEATVSQYVALDEDGLLPTINKLRREKGFKELVWDNTHEKELVERAAELGVNYSDYRLNGDPKIEDWHGAYLDTGEAAALPFEDRDFLELIYQENISTFCAGIVQNNNGDVYIAVRCTNYPAQPAESESLYENDAYDICLNVLDENIRLKSTFTKKNGASPAKTANGAPLLSIGYTYEYWLHTKNVNDKNHEMLVAKVDGKSSKTAVATIDEEGYVKTKRAGVTKLTIKPGEDSSKAFSKTIVVKPNRTKSVKATSPKKGIIKVTWAKQAGVNGYQVLRSTKKNSGYKAIKTITSGTTKAYADTKAKKGSTYYYKVRAYVKYNNKKYFGLKSAPARCKCKRT